MNFQIGKYNREGTLVQSLTRFESLQSQHSGVGRFKVRNMSILLLTLVLYTLTVGSLGQTIQHKNGGTSSVRVQIYHQGKSDRSNEKGGRMQPLVNFDFNVRHPMKVNEYFRNPENSGSVSYSSSKGSSPQNNNFRDLDYNPQMRSQHGDISSNYDHSSVIERRNIFNENYGRGSTEDFYRRNSQPGPPHLNPRSLSPYSKHSSREIYPPNFRNNVYGYADLNELSQYSESNQNYEDNQRGDYRESTKGFYSASEGTHRPFQMNQMGNHHPNLFQGRIRKISSYNSRRQRQYFDNHQRGQSFLENFDQLPKSSNSFEDRQSNNNPNRNDDYEYEKRFQVGPPPAGDYSHLNYDENNDLNYNNNEDIRNSNNNNIGGLGGGNRQVSPQNDFQSRQDSNNNQDQRIPNNLNQLFDKFGREEDFDSVGDQRQFFHGQFNHENKHKLTSQPLPTTFPDEISTLIPFFSGQEELSRQEGSSQFGDYISSSNTRRPQSSPLSFKGSILQQFDEMNNVRGGGNELGPKPTFFTPQFTSPLPSPVHSIPQHRGDQSEANSIFPNQQEQFSPELRHPPSSSSPSPQRPTYNREDEIKQGQAFQDSFVYGPPKINTGYREYGVPGGSENPKPSPLSLEQYRPSSASNFEAQRTIAAKYNQPPPLPSPSASFSKEFGPPTAPHAAYPAASNGGYQSAPSRAEFRPPYDTAYGPPPAAASTNSGYPAASQHSGYPAASSVYGPPPAAASQTSYGPPPQTTSNVYPAAQNRVDFRPPYDVSYGPPPANTAASQQQHSGYPAAASSVYGPPAQPAASNIGGYPSASQHQSGYPSATASVYGPPPVAASSLAIYQPSSQPAASNIGGYPAASQTQFRPPPDSTSYGPPPAASSAGGYTLPRPQFIPPVGEAAQSPLPQYISPRGESASDSQGLVLQPEGQTVTVEAITHNPILDQSQPQTFINNFETPPGKSKQDSPPTTKFQFHIVPRIHVYAQQLQENGEASSFRPSAIYGLPKEAKESKTKPIYSAPNDGEESKSPSTFYGSPKEGKESKPAPVYGVPKHEEESRPSPRYGTPKDAEESKPNPVYGIPKDEEEESRPPPAVYGVPKHEEESRPSPRYGLPKDTGESKPKPIYGLPKDEEETRPRPIYGLPREEGESKPNPVYGIPRDEEENRPRPVYGLPKEEGESKPRPVYGVPKDEGESKPKPIYGLPEDARESVNLEYGPPKKEAQASVKLEYSPPRKAQESVNLVYGPPQRDEEATVNIEYGPPRKQAQATEVKERKNGYDYRKPSQTRPRPKKVKAGYEYRKPAAQTIKEVVKGGYPAAQTQKELRGGYPAAQTKSEVRGGYPAAQTKNEVRGGYPAAQTKNEVKGGYPAAQTKSEVRGGYPAAQTQNEVRGGYDYRPGSAQTRKEIKLNSPIPRISSEGLNAKVSLASEPKIISKSLDNASSKVEALGSYVLDSYEVSDSANGQFSFSGKKDGKSKSVLDIPSSMGGINKEGQTVYLISRLVIMDKNKTQKQGGEREVGSASNNQPKKFSRKPQNQNGIKRPTNKMNELGMGNENRIFYQGQKKNRQNRNYPNNINNNNNGRRIGMANNKRFLNQQQGHFRNRPSTSNQQIFFGEPPNRLNNRMGNFRNNNMRQLGMGKNNNRFPNRGNNINKQIIQELKIINNKIEKIEEQISPNKHQKRHTNINNNNKESNQSPLDSNENFETEENMSSSIDILEFENISDPLE